MKKTITSITLLAAASAAYAGTYVQEKNVIMPPSNPPMLEDSCFGPGWELGFFGSDFIGVNNFNEKGRRDDKEHPNFAGGGVTVSYFFTQNLGIETSYNIATTNSEIHGIRAAVVYRFPIDTINLAPYVLAGGGVDLSNFEAGAYHAGAGVEYRFPDANCMGIFTDGTYNFSNQDNNDHVLLRAGVRFKF